MKKAINRKKTEITDVVAEYEELVNIHSDKVSECLKNEYCFKQMKEDFNDMDDFEELKQFYFNLGVEFRQFIIEYNINHDLIKEKAINIFLKQKSFLHILKEKPDEEPIDYNNDDTSTVDNKEEKEMIENVRENKQDKKQKKNDCLKEEMLDNNKKQKKKTII